MAGCRSFRRVRVLFDPHEPRYPAGNPARVITFEETRREHCPILARNMREGDKRECEDVGFTPQKAVWRSYRHSLMARTYFVDGELAAIVGMGGNALSDTGAPWLFTTYAVERVPLGFVRHSRAYVEEMLSVKPFLENYVSANYPQAVKFVQAVGFTLGETVLIGDQRAMFYRFFMERN